MPARLGRGARPARRRQRPGLGAPDPTAVGRWPASARPWRGDPADANANEFASRGGARPLARRARGRQTSAWALAARPALRGGLRASCGWLPPRPFFRSTTRGAIGSWEALSPHLCVGISVASVPKTRRASIRPVLPRGGSLPSRQANAWPSAWGVVTPAAPQGRFWAEPPSRSIRNGAHLRSVPTRGSPPLNRPTCDPTSCACGGPPCGEPARPSRCPRGAWRPPGSA